MKPSALGRQELRVAPALAGLDDPSLDAVLACATFRDLAAGDVLFRQGDPGDTMVVVLRGMLSVELVGTRGTHRMLGAVRVGELMGEMACMDPAPRAATARALEPCRVCEISRPNLAILRQHAPRAFSTLVGEVIREVTRRLRDVDAQIQGECSPAPSQPPPATVRSRPSEPPPTAEPRRRSGFFGWVDRVRSHT